jgi:N-acetylneuraminic acid mutarotase
MRRPLLLLLVAMLLLTACGGAATPAPQAPAQKPVEQKPAAAKPTEAPAAPAQPAPATLASLATVQPEFKPPQSGGVLNPPTIVPTPKNNPADIAAPPEGWQQIANSIVPPARYDHVLVFVPEFNQLVLFGGRSRNALNDTWIYDIAGNTWRPITSTSKPDACYDMNAVYDLVRQRVLIFGGRDREDSYSSFFNDVWAFDPKTERWNKLATSGLTVRPRYGASAVIDPRTDRLIISHGQTNRGYPEDTLALNLKTNIWEDLSPQDRLQRLSSRRDHEALFDTPRNRMLVLDGCDGTCPLDEFWMFEPDARRWTQLPPSSSWPPARSQFTFVHTGQTMWLFGGKTDNKVTNDLWMFDPATNTWTQIASSSEPVSRSGHAATWDSLNNRLFVFGGQDAKGNALNDLWTYTR